MFGRCAGVCVCVCVQGAGQGALYASSGFFNVEGKLGGNAATKALHKSTWIWHTVPSHTIWSNTKLEAIGFKDPVRPF
jgi:hypothetical protein